MATRAWVRRLGTGDEYRIERDAEGSITWASGPFHATADTITGPPTNLPNDPEVVEDMNRNPDDYEDVPTRTIQP